MTTRLKKANALMRSGRIDEAEELYLELADSHPTLASLIDVNLCLIKKMRLSTRINRSINPTLTTAPDTESKGLSPVTTNLEPFNKQLAGACQYGGLYYWPLALKGNTVHGGRRLSGVCKSNAPTLPLVSVVTTVFNREDSIKRCINSVLDQTYPNIEHIIVDGSSSDKTFEKVREYGDHIEYYLSEPDSGIYEGMNKGLALAQGTFAIILNSDDWFVDGAIEKLVTCAAIEKADIVAGGVFLVDPDGKAARQSMSRWDSSVYLCSPARHGTMLVSAEAYRYIGLYSTSNKVLSDRLWMQLAFNKGISVALLDECVLYFSETGISSQAGQVYANEKASQIERICPTVTLQDQKRLATPWKLTPKESEALCFKYRDSSNLRKALSPNWRKCRFGSDRPAFSVQIPVFNASRYIDDCLNSVLSQKFENIEVVCVDDGSTDDSYDRILAQSKADPRILPIRFAQNRGTLQARKRAFEEATGEYMVFLDADDVFSQDAFTLICDRIGDTDIDIDLLQFGANIWDPDDALTTQVKNSYEDYFSSIPDAELLGEDVVQEFPGIVKSNFCISCVKKSVFKKVIRHIPEGAVRHGNDNLVMFLIAYYSKHFATLNHSLYKYRASHSTSNLTCPDPRLAMEHIRSRSFVVVAVQRFLQGQRFIRFVNPSVFARFRASTETYCKKIIERCVEKYPETRDHLEYEFNKSFHLRTSCKTE